MFDYECKAAVVEIAHRLARRGFAGTFEGNISYRNGERIYMTPTTQDKETLTEGKIICIDIDGNQEEGDLAKTSEYILHTEIYRMRSDVNAVVHCHAPFRLPGRKRGSHMKQNVRLKEFFNLAECHAVDMECREQGISWGIFLNI